MGKNVATIVSYQCDNCAKTSAAENIWYEIYRASSHLSTYKIIFCSEECAREWPAKQVELVRLLSPYDLQLKLADRLYPDAIGNTD